MWETNHLGMRVTVDMKLAQLGACADRDGKLYDSHGRPIEFCRPPGGMQLPRDVEAEYAYRMMEAAKYSSDWPDLSPTGDKNAEPTERNIRAQLDEIKRFRIAELPRGGVAGDGGGRVPVVTH